MPEPQPKPTRRAPGRRPSTEGSADDTRRHIRREAMRLFNERGYAAVSIDDIARAAALTRATLYYHYAGKAEIFVEAILNTLEIAHTGIGLIVGIRHLTVAERAALIVQGRREVRDTLLSDEEVDEAMVEEAMPYLNAEQQARVKAGLEQLHTLTRDLFAEGVARDELRPVAPELLDFLFWQTFQITAYPRNTAMTLEELENELVAMFLRAVTQ